MSRVQITRDTAGHQHDQRQAKADDSNGVRPLLDAIGVHPCGKGFLGAVHAWALGILPCGYKFGVGLEDQIVSHFMKPNVRSFLQSVWGNSRQSISGRDMQNDGTYYEPDSSFAHETAQLTNRSCSCVEFLESLPIHVHRNGLPFCECL